MPSKVFKYLVEIQFLGFRYSGWQRQPGQRTIEGMLLKTLNFIMPHLKIKVLGAGRTDAKVSALEHYFELFVKECSIGNTSEFMALFNKNLPPDIRITAIKPIDEQFNIIKNSKRKEYVYLFSFGKKNHPFAAPYMANISEDLNIDDMIQAAALFQGTHDFSAYTARLRKNSKTVRTVERCLITENTLLTANFFPSKSYALHIESTGFIRYQVRMIMGALIELGRGAITSSLIESSLMPGSLLKLHYVAPGSGLLLNTIDFN